MDCNTCQKELDLYTGGVLSPEKKKEVDEHLKECRVCSEILSRLIIAEKVISEDKKAESNPFLSTRVMAAIDALEGQKIATDPSPLFVRILKPALITVTISVAIGLGVLLGNVNRNVNISNQVPEEIAYINDSEMESLNLITSE